MAGRADLILLEDSGTHDPFALPYNGAAPILGLNAGEFNRPIDYVPNIETGYGPYPFGTLANVVGVPAVTGTAAVGKNPWDTTLGIPSEGLVNQTPFGTQPLVFGSQPETGM